MPNSIPFRYRAHEVSRVEAFSDVIFGFAISLLVVSLEAPKSYHEMIEMLRGFFPFAICFFILINIWFEHHAFYKRYAMHDTGTMALNTLLLFVVLYYVYPLKYMFWLFARGIQGERSDIPPGGAPVMFTIYGVGFTAVYWLLAAMFYRAYKRRGELGLNDVERIDTLESTYDNFFMGCFGVLSMIVAQFRPGLAGPVYFLIAVPKTLVPMLMRPRRRRSEQAMLTTQAAA